MRRICHIIIKFQEMALRYDGKVVVVTGAGSGLGRQYALFFGSRGAKVLVNDLGGSVQGQGQSSQAADVVVKEIIAAGGQAAANYDSVEFGDKIIQSAINAFGTVHIVINNAGILKDVSFGKMTSKDWEIIQKVSETFSWDQVHMQGSFEVSKAAWKYMRDQKYGRIINTGSSSGLYGNFGQVNYSAAKAGLHGFTQALAKEGEKYNILVNTIAPVAASRMTETVMPANFLEKLKPKYVVPLVAFLCHESNTENGSIFEVAAGYIAKLRLQRSEGVFLSLDHTPEEVKEHWSKIVSFDQNAEYPTSGTDTMARVTQNLERLAALEAKPKL